jgi:hypothetical protein
VWGGWGKTLDSQLSTGRGRTLDRQGWVVTGLVKLVTMVKVRETWENPRTHEGLPGPAQMTSGSG